MWNNKKTKNTPKVKSVSGSSAINNITQGTHIEGTIKSENDFRIDGYLKGNLSCEGKVIIGEHGVADGRIVCEDAVIEGKLNGELLVNNSLQIASSGVVDGKVNTAHLAISPGAKFNGICQMGGKDVLLESENVILKQQEEALQIEAITGYED